jgi:hypothetical protein
MNMEGRLMRALILTLILLASAWASAAQRKFDPSFAPRFQGTKNYFPTGTTTLPEGEIYEFDFQSDGKIKSSSSAPSTLSIPFPPPTSRA